MGSEADPSVSEIRILSSGLADGRALKFPENRDLSGNFCGFAALSPFRRQFPQSFQSVVGEFPEHLAKTMNLFAISMRYTPIP
jgi:hypothetical protein